jgi:hypothetical protein
MDNGKNVKTKVNYGTLLYKLKIELIQNVTIEPKKPKVDEKKLKHNESYLMFASLWISRLHQLSNMCQK